MHGVSWLKPRAMIVAAVAALMVLGGAISSSAHATETTETTESTADTEVERAILRIDDGVDAVALVSGYGGEVVDVLESLDSVVADLPAAALDAMRDDVRVIEATPDSELELVDSDDDSGPTPSEVALGQSNAAQFVDSDYDRTDRGSSFDEFTVDEVADVVGADEAHEDGVTGAGVDVAVLDTGIAPVDGLAEVINGADLSFESQVPDLQHLDTNGHGTHLSGIISGIAPDSRLVNVKVGQFDGAADVSQVLAAIDWIVQHGQDDEHGLNIRVLNLAYGTQNEQSYLVDPLAYAAEVAWHNGIVVVTAAGNGGSAADGRLTNPAINPYVLAVGASEAHGTYTTVDDTVADFSSTGNAERGVDLVAPGRSIASLRTPGSFIDEQHPEGRVGDDLFRGSGTSQSAAVTAGAAALLLDDQPDLTPDQVKATLTRSAKNLPRSGDAQGAGILDVRRALLGNPVNADNADQTWPTSSGTGSLEGARGSSHVQLDGEVLTGEQDIFGEPWDGTSWSGTSWSGTSWSGGVWNGTSWSGTSWSGTSWSGTSWSGTSWSGTSWSGTSWSGTSWSGTSWSGTSWSGTSWSGTSWSGTSWSTDQYE